MKFSLSTLLLIFIIAGMIAGWYVDRTGWNSERAELTAKRETHTSRICNGSQTVGSVVEFRNLMENDGVRSQFDDQKLDLMIYNHVRSIWSSHADINYALSEIEGIQTNGKFDYAQIQATSLIELMGITSVESFLDIGASHPGYNCDRASYPEIFDTTSSEHSSFSAFVSRCIKKRSSKTIAQTSAE